MPKRTYKRKTTRRTTRYYRQPALKPVGPIKLKRMLPYCEADQLVPGAGTSVVIYKANGIYDPTVAIGGHQPRGFDQYMAMYDHFVVIGAKICVDYIPGKTATAPLVQHAVAGIAVRDSTTTGTANDYIEGRICKYAPITLNTYGYEAPRLKLELDVNPAKFLGRSKPLADSQLKGDAATDPAELAYFHIFAGKVGPANVEAIEIHTYLEYMVMFIEPKDPGQS